MAWTSSTFSTLLDVVAAGLRHSTWLWIAIAAALILFGLARRLRPVILRSGASAMAFGLALSGVLSAVVWMDARYQLMAPLRALADWQTTAQNNANQRVLVLNAPDHITLGSAIAGLSAEMESLPPAWNDQVITFAQMIEGDIGAPGRINGMAAQYSGELKFDRAQMVTQTTSHDLVIVAGGSARGFEARVVAEQIPTPDSYLARLELGGNVVFIRAAQACFQGNLLNRALVTQASLQVDAGAPTTAKLFRQALAGPAQEQVGSNDASLFGGLLELHELPVGRTYTDVSAFTALTQPSAQQVRLGLYDWQTGERWLALKADGTQWPDNAVIVDVQAVCGAGRAS